MSKKFNRHYVLIIDDVKNTIRTHVSTVSGELIEQAKPEDEF